MALQERWNRGSFPRLVNGKCLYSKIKKRFDVRDAPFPSYLQTNDPKMTYTLLCLKRLGTKIVLADTLSIPTGISGNKYSRRVIINGS